MLELRPLVKSDQERLWRWLHLALWDPPPAPPRPMEVLQAPEVRIFAEDWGRPSDIGIVAVVDGVDAGACWMRVMRAGLGSAFVDEGIPQLGIALTAPFQRLGYGEIMLRAALALAWGARYEQVSLTVHPQNPAIALYERCGFSKIGLRQTYHLMVARRPWTV